MEEERKGRSVPINELDFNAMLSNPVWGQELDNRELKKKLTNLEVVKDKNGNPLFQDQITEKEDGQNVINRVPIVNQESEYESLSFINRDFRLGNLKKWSGEREYCEHWVNLAHDCLQLGMKKSHSASLSRTATKLELSQSDNGFFRKIMNTFREEKISQELEPPKRSLFSGNNKKKGEY